MQNVTCLIPAFKVRYLHDLLSSLIAQSFLPSRVILSDDTHNFDFHRLLAESELIKDLSQSLGIEFVRGPRRGHRENIEFLLSLFRDNPTEFFHIMLDDDLIHPDFYKTHIHAHSQTFSLCSISRRLLMTEQGVSRAVPGLPKEFSGRDGQICIVKSEFLIPNIIEPRMGNWLGELSFGVFREQYIQNPSEFCTMSDVSFAGLNDLGNWLKCSLQSPLIFINEPFGRRRFTQGSISFLKGYFYSLSILARVPLAIVLYDLKKIKFSDLIAILKQTKARWVDFYGQDTLRRILGDFDQLTSEDIYGEFKSRFLDFWDHYRHLPKDQVDLSTRQHLIDYLNNQEAENS
jgi:hypothetical protein